MKVFIDTNIFVYAQTNDLKSEKSLELLASGGVISIQVLNELANVLSKKFQRDWQDIENVIRDIKLLRFEIIPVTFSIHETAIHLARDYNISFYDALIIAAASIADCTVLYSEDMQNGRQISGLTVLNPFI